MKNIRIRVAGILIQDGRILLVRHEKNGKSYWLIPGGGIDFGETAEESLVREYREEVGLDIQVGQLVLVHDSVPPDNHRQGLNLYFLVTADKVDIKVTPDGILKDADFHSFDKFMTLTVRPEVKTEILNGIASDWEGGCIYLGNEWRD